MDLCDEVCIVMEKLGQSVIPGSVKDKPHSNDRRIKWEYVIPIIFTPTAHAFVSLVRKYPQYRKKLYWGVGIATFMTLQARFILMYDAGYPGAEKVDKEGLPWYLKILLL